MSPRLLALALPVLVACGGPSAPLPGPTNDTTESCNGPTPAVVMQGANVYDAITVQAGFVYLELPGSGVDRCATTGCAAPDSVLANPAFVSETLGSALVYTTQIAAPAGGVEGEIHSVAVDGSGDQTLLSNVDYPAYIVTSGARTFWAEDSFALDDTPATIDCLGCTNDGMSTPWVGGLGGGTYGMMSDANNVYVLADDASLMSVSLLSCSVSAPCLTAPRVVLGQLDRTISAQQIASDGTYVYVARVVQNDVVRVDSSGTVTELVTSQAVSAIALDATSLYFGTQTGAVGKVPLGGGSSTMLACSGDPIAGLAVDQANAYFITGSSGSNVMRIATH